MKNLFLLLFLILILMQTVEARTLRPNKRYYNPLPYNGVYYNYPRGFYNYRYNNYPKNFYNYQKPVIYKRSIKRSCSEDELLVANQFSGLKSIEKQVFGQSYEFDNLRIRIERLEQKIFGTIQNGSLEDRFLVLKSAVKNYKAFDPYGQKKYNAYDSYQAPIFSGASGAGWKNTLLGNFKNQFIGGPTGFTPAMDPAYMDYFEAEREMMKSGQSSSYRTRNGYYNSNVNRGVGTGVTILD